MIWRILFCISLFLLCFQLTTQGASAAEFSTELVSTYTVRDDGTTSVKHDFSIENLVSTEYITNYAFEMPGSHIEGIQVESGGKRVENKLTSLKNKSSVAIQFSDKVVGKGKKRLFSVSYNTPDISTKLGKVLEVSIPRLVDPSAFTAYTVRLQVPSSFGTPSRTQPKSFLTANENGKTVLTFSDLSQNSAISVLFGKEQLAKLTLGYHIQNTTNKKAETQVAIPADGTFQRVYYESIKPKPDHVVSDNDKNWLASFTLEPGQQQTITANLYVQTQPEPQDTATLLGSRPSTSYTHANTFWPSDDRSMQKIANQLRTPENIYRYVIEHLNYDYSRKSDENTRLGASDALRSPSLAQCQEFTDLFVTLARAAGINARQVVGYAYTQNPSLRPVGIATDVLHSWPEYFDETTFSWNAVDPTWEQTTGGVDYFHSIDFNRIVFAIHGLSSTSPLPAGMYKQDGQESKDVDVRFVEAIPDFPPSFTSRLRIHPRAILGLSETYSINIHNDTLVARYAVPVHIVVTNSAGTIEQEQKLEFIPDEEKEIPVQLPSSGLFPSGNTKITVTVGSQNFTHELTLTTTIRQILPLLVLILVVGTSIGICAIITRRLLVPRWKR